MTPFTCPEPMVVQSLAAAEQYDADWTETVRSLLARARGQHFLDSLAIVGSEAATQGWAGPFSVPVPAEAIRYARDLLLQLPDWIPAPSIGGDPEGEVTLEWYARPGWRLLISIDGSGRLAHSALLGGERLRGAVYFVDSLPEPVLTSLQRLLAGSTE